eukprot:TRINITY_DN781_c0_g2_i1.p1 TRINITY_DN781_c0_g2~~TRINITY_DN781_c0_g2_i1.p1  ORF type:complete len:249 (-),score=72.74 TRINITY_DN781_c0_g2_i1:22-717(-)
MADEYDYEEVFEQTDAVEEYLDGVDLEEASFEEEDDMEQPEADGEEATELTGQIITDSFGELMLPVEQTTELVDAWDLLIKTVGGRDAVGDLLYETYFNASSTLESLFTTNKKIIALRFFQGINSYITTSAQPLQLRTHVESLAYGHMSLDVTIPRINIIRDAVIDMLVVELGSKLNSAAATACVSLYNYIGGAMIYIREASKERMEILQDSWKLANDENKNAERMASASM